MPSSAAPFGLPLPPPREEGVISVEQALWRRRCVRDYSHESLTLAELAQLLWAAQGMTSDDGYRTCPSAGALYPLEAFAVVGHVVSLSAGIYKYDPQRHELLLLEEGDRRAALAEAALEQEWLAAAPVTMVLAAVPERTTIRYGRRGHRYIEIEAGHAAQNVCLQAVALGLAAGLVGAFGDAEVHEVVGMERNEEPLYLLPLGRL